MSWIVFFFAFEAGIAREAIQFMNYEIPEIEIVRNPMYEMDWCGYADLTCGVLLFEHVRVSGGVKTYFVPVDMPYFAPHRSIYTINIALEFDWLTVGVEHACDHRTEAGVVCDEIAAFHEKAYVRIEVGR
jgi:hypothetical protein